MLGSLGDRGRRTSRPDPGGLSSLAELKDPVDTRLLITLRLPDGTEHLAALFVTMSGELYDACRAGDVTVINFTLIGDG